MPNSLSSKKRVRQNDKRRLHKRVLHSRLRTQLRKSRSAKTVEEMAAQLPKSGSALDRAASKGVIHRNTASRKKGRLARALAKAEAGS